MIVHRFALYFAIFFLAVLSALAGTYFYGRFFQHDRYWEGTIMRVQKNQTKMIEGLLTFDRADQFFLQNIDKLPAVFDILNGKLSIIIKDGAKVVYSNHYDRYKIQTTSNITFSQSELSVQVSTYVPPVWSRNYLAWLSRPREWLTPRFDYITVPFIGLLLIFIGAFSGMVWRYRAAHLSNEVLAILKKIEITNAPH